jgi:hypothetical protein
MSKAALDKFGKLLMTQVRDESISDWKLIVDGQMKDEDSKRICARLSEFTPHQRDVLLGLVPEIVDTVLHHLLWTLEQEGDVVQIGVRAKGGFVSSLNEVFDGLAGELYSEDGWIARFSKETASDHHP